MGVKLVFLGEWRTGRLRLDSWACLSYENEEIRWVWEGLMSLPEQEKKGQHARKWEGRGGHHDMT